MNQTTAKDVAAYLVNRPECFFSNTFDGNMKLQKLLVFANLIHYANYEEFLFNDDMYAFRNGIVIEEVRMPFFEDYHGYMQSLKSQTNLDFTNEQLDSINMSIEIFNKLSAKDLSDLHHELETWKIKYPKSRFGNTHIKELGLIRHNEVLTSDIEKIKKVISSYQKNEEQQYLYEKVNGITFYYNPNEISLDNNNLLDYLENISRSVVGGEDDTFFLAYDDEQGIYYY